MVRSIRNTLQSKKYIEKRKRRKVFVVLSIILLIALLIFFLVYLIRLPSWQIRDVHVKGILALDEGDVVSKTLETLQGESLGFIPKSSVFFYSKSKIEKGLLDEFREIESIKVVRSGFSSVDVNIIERVSQALVCEGFKEEDEVYNHKCMYVDGDGYIYSKPFINQSDNDLLKFYSNVFTDQMGRGQELMDRDIFVDFQTMMKNLVDNDIEASSILISGQHNYELYIRNLDGTNAIVYLDDRSSLVEASEKLVAFWNSFVSSQDTSQKEPTAFDYIDLRFGKNIFYVTR